MNAELKSVLTTVQSQYLCLAPSWLLLLQSDIDDEDSEDSGLPSHFFTILTIYSHLEGIGRHGAGEQLEPGLVWQRLEMESVSMLSCHHVTCAVVTLAVLAGEICGILNRRSRLATWRWIFVTGVRNIWKTFSTNIVYLARISYTIAIKLEST